MPLSLARVTVVRPYGQRIRARVFALLEAVGYRVRAEDVIEEGAGDQDAVQRIIALGARRLVVPYHGHRDRAGAVLDGLGLLRRLHEAVPTFPYRVLMPVSRFGAAAVEVARQRLPLELAPAIVFVNEDELGEPGLVSRVAEHFEIDAE